MEEEFKEANMTWTTAKRTAANRVRWRNIVTALCSTKRQLTKETLVTLGLLSQVGFPLKNVVLLVRCCVGNIFSKCNRFPYQPTKINEWFTIACDAEVR